MSSKQQVMLSNKLLRFFFKPSKTCDVMFDVDVCVCACSSLVIH